MSKPAAGSHEAPPAASGDDKERLRQSLPAAVELLRTRQAGRIGAVEIEEYVALNWLEWHGGTLRVTVTGSNVCAQIASARRQ